ncbi:MAG: YgcG family protein [Burkholderiaceae bacterium]|nr:MAG: YgcG family protein [Burkholderiaceae bacterium]
MPLALIRQALTAILFIAFGCLPALAQGGLQPIPALTRAIIDPTGTLASADVAALEARLQAVERTRGAQIVVLMVATTAPEDIAAYANRVGNTWKIGRRDVGDGVLVLVAQSDRKMRIEVAKALEGAIPDIAAARIIDSAMKPRFQQGDFAGGLMAAVDALDARLAEEALPLPSPTSTPNTAPVLDETRTLWVAFGCIAIMALAPVARQLVGRVKGSLTAGCAIGVATLVFSSHWEPALIAGLLATVFCFFCGAPRRPRRVLRRGRGARGGGGWIIDSSRSDSWSSGSSDSGGFSSGGGGDFGGGGASGDW